MGWQRRPSSPLQSDRWWLAPAAFRPRREAGQLQGAWAVPPTQMAGLEQLQIASALASSS
jgi:hypothetical protein